MAQSGWSFTVKQGGTTVHEAYTVSTSSFTMEVEAATHVLRWIATRGDSRTTHAIIFTDSMSLLQKVEREAQTGMCQWLTPPSKTPVGVLPWTCLSEGK